jgi:hypothetical protein
VTEQIGERGKVLRRHGHHEARWICDQTRQQGLELLQVYCRDSELFVGNAVAGLL